MSETDVPNDVVTDAQIFAALVETDGNIAEAARALGKRRDTLKKRIDKSPDLIALCEDMSEELVDIAEKNIRRDLNAGDGPTSRFVASTKGKNRGWTAAGVNASGAIMVEIRQFPDDTSGDKKNGP